MNIEEIRDYCLAKPAVTEGFPFDETTLVFKVMNKVIVKGFYTESGTVGKVFQSINSIWGFLNPGYGPIGPNRK